MSNITIFTTNIFENRIFYALLSMFIGFSLWSNMTQWITQTVWLNLPICFYNGDELNFSKIDSPRTINVRLKGPANLIKTIKNQNPALHIDLKSLNLEENRIELSKKLMFLPDAVNIVEARPAFIKINIKK